MKPEIKVNYSYIRMTGEVSIQQSCSSASDSLKMKQRSVQKSQNVSVLHRLILYCGL